MFQLAFYVVWELEMKKVNIKRLANLLYLPKSTQTSMLKNCFPICCSYGSVLTFTLCVTSVKAVSIVQGINAFVGP